MKSIQFEGCNAAIGKDQPEYETLHAFVDYQEVGRDDAGNPILSASDVTCCFELSDEEMEELKKTKKIWFRQLVFGQRFQPILITVNPLYQHNGSSTEQG